MTPGVAAYVTDNCEQFKYAVITARFELPALEISVMFCKTYYAFEGSIKSHLRVLDIAGKLIGLNNGEALFST